MVAFFYKNLYDSSIQSFNHIINTSKGKQKIKINLWFISDSSFELKNQIYFSDI